MNTITRAARSVEPLLVAALVALGTTGTAHALEPLVAVEHRSVHNMAPTEGWGDYEAIAEAVADFDHYAGAVNTSAPVRDRGFTLELPESGEILQIENLEITEIEGGYALASATLAEGPTVNVVIMGGIVQGTIMVDYEDLYTVSPLGDDIAAVHYQDRWDGISDDHGHGHEIVEPGAALNDVTTLKSYAQAAPKRAAKTVMVDYEDPYTVSPLGDDIAAVHYQDRWDEMSEDPGHEHEIVDPSAALNDVTTLKSYAQAAPERATKVVTQQSPAVIDILFLYNAKARERTGHVPSQMALTIEHMNRFFANSEVSTRVRIAALHEVDYDVASNHEQYRLAITRLTIPDDGHFDDVEARKEQTGADVVGLLLGHENQTICGGGLAPILRFNESTGFGQNLKGTAVFIAALGVPTHCLRVSARTIAHELVHVLGALHNPENFENNLEAVQQRYVPYGFGYCNLQEKFRTIMSTSFIGTGTNRQRCFGGPHGLGPDSFSNPDVRFGGFPTGTAELHDVARMIDEHAPHVAAFYERPTPQVRSWHLPFLPQANGGALLGFIRIHNLTNERAEIQIYGYDETGERSGPLTTAIDPGRTRGYNAHHLEGITPHSTLEGTLPDGEGHWRLMVRSATPLEVRAYTRTNESGFASPVHLRAALVPGSAPRAYHVPFLNPGSNLGSRGYLRISNPSWQPNTVTIRAWDDLGEPAEEDVTLTIGPRATETLSAQNLESGYPDQFDGQFGDGTGKWRVRVESADQRTIFVLGLVANRDGAVHNVSR